jgi:hypothetical protein
MPEFVKVLEGVHCEKEIFHLSEFLQKTGIVQRTIPVSRPSFFTAGLNFLKAIGTVSCFS